MSRLVLVRSPDKRRDLYIRREGWKPGDKAVARAFNAEDGEALVEAFNTRSLCSRCGFTYGECGCLPAGESDC